MYTDAVAIRNAAIFGESNTTLFLSDVFCRGNEVNILDCSTSGIGQHDCASSETAGVNCEGMLQFQSDERFLSFSTTPL